MRNGPPANEMAVRLTDAVRDIPGVAIAVPPAVNAVFAEVPLAAIEPLQAWSFFWEWDLTASLLCWMTSFVTTTDDVERFAAGVRAIVADYLCPDLGHTDSTRTCKSEEHTSELQYLIRTSLTA